MGRTFGVVWGPTTVRKLPFGLVVGHTPALPTSPPFPTLEPTAASTDRPAHIRPRGPAADAKQPLKRLSDGGGERRLVADHSPATERADGLRREVDAKKHNPTLSGQSGLPLAVIQLDACCW